MFKQNEEAVSPVIGVILMVAITVILAAVIAVFVFGFGSSESKGPTTSIRVSPNLETINVMDIKIQHNGGDRLVSGDWHLSIVPVGQPPIFRASSSDFGVGDMIITTNVTDGTGNYSVTKSGVYSVPPSQQFISGGKYDVKIVGYPFETLVLDTEIIFTETLFNFVKAEVISSENIPVKDYIKFAKLYPDVIARMGILVCY